MTRTRQWRQREYRAELAIQKKLAANSPAVAEHRQALGRSHDDLGAFLEILDRRSEAETEYRLALAIRQNLVAEFPAVAGYRVDLGGSYDNLGRLMAIKGQSGDALVWFQKSIDALRPVLQLEPGNKSAQRSLRKGYWGRAMAYDTLKRHGEAQKDWDRAIELSPGEVLGPRALRAISRAKAGQFAEAVADVAELTKSAGWSAGTWFNFACVYAIACGKLAHKKREYADRAMELLQKAEKAGWRNAAQMKKITTSTRSTIAWISRK
jgi:tetratricopeptide (TPR) repeat protein